MSWPVSDAFKAAVVNSHTPTMKVEILENGVVVASTDVLTLTQDLVVLSGSVSEDRKAQVGRRTVEWALVDAVNAFTPLATASVVYPLIDRDVRLWRGIGAELVPLATVQLATLKVRQESGGTTYAMLGADRSTVVAAADWKQELDIAAGTTPRAATLAILAQVDPAHTYVLIDAPTTKTLDELVFIPGEDPNPWTAIQQIWESAAQEVFFDQLGQVKTQPIPDPLTTPPVWSFLDGQASIRVDPLEVDVDRSSIRNGVIVRGSAPWLLYGVQAEAWDTNPASSTYYDPANPSASVVGPHPEYVDDPLVSNTTEAQALATAKLPNILGIEEQVTFNSVPNPSLAAGDVVQIGTGLLGATSRYILDQLKTPLTYEGTQSANTRRRRQ